MSEAVKNNTTMTKLYLSGEHISNSKVDQTFKKTLVYHHSGNKIADEVKDEIKGTMSPMKPFRFGWS